MGKHICWNYILILQKNQVKKNKINVKTFLRKCFYFCIMEKDLILSVKNAVQALYGAEIGDEQVYIKGNIIATGGRIGNMTIEEFEEFGIYETKITSDQGTIFKGSIETIKLTAHLYRNGSLVGPEEGNFAYQWKINGADIPGENS